MNPIIKTSNYTKVALLNNTTDMPDLNYDILSNPKKPIDMRKSAIINNTDDLKYDIENVSKNSKIPIPGLFVNYDENTDNTYIPPHSDWTGPTGLAWIGK